MLELLIAYAIPALLLFVVFGAWSMICMSLNDEKSARLFALAAMTMLVWPLALVFGVCYIVVWTLKQGTKALWNLREGTQDD